jgi:hypothetical protein
MVAGTQGSLHKAGSTKMINSITIAPVANTAGIDTSKHKLDVAVPDRAMHFQVDNALPGWRRLSANSPGQA